MNLRRISSFFLILTLLLTATLLSVNAAPPAQGADYDIPNGHFYTQTTNGQGGFSGAESQLP